MTGPSANEPVRIEIDEDGQRYTIDYSGHRMLTIGRAADCDIVLHTKKASRVHCEVFGEGGRFTLVDAGSANGTQVNGESVSRHPLELGDEIRIGSARIRFGDKPRVAPRAPGRDRKVRTGAGAAKGGEASAAGEGAPSGGGSRNGRPAAAPRPRDAAEPTSLASRGPSGAQRAVQIAIPAGLLCVLCYGVYLFINRDTTPSRSGDSNVASVPGDSPSRTTRDLTAEERAALVDQDLLSDPLDAVSAFDEVRRELAGGTMGWDGIDRLHDLRASYPGTQAAEKARRWIEALEGVRKGVHSGDRQQSAAVVQGLLKDERFGAALAVSEFLHATATDDKAKEHWKSFGADVRANARSRFRRLERDLSNLLAAGNGADALRALVDVQDRFAGFDFFSEELPRYVEASLEGPAEEVIVTPPVVAELRERIARAFDACRFGDMPALYYQTLSYSLPAEERAAALEGLVEAFYLERLFDDVVTGAAGTEITLSFSDQYEGKIIRVTDEEIEQELDVGGHTYRQVIKWSRLGPVKKFALFRSVPLSPDAILGLAYYCYRIGHEEGVDNALIRLHKRKDTKHLAEAILAQKRGIVIPDGGFVEHRGRLITTAERDSEIALRKKRREEEREALAQLKEMKQASKIESYITGVKRLRLSGNFELAQRILYEIVHRWPESPASKEAQALIDNPVLATTRLVENGPRANRLDIVFMGDGWPVENDYQEAFTYRVATCRHLFMNEQPYKEYQSYINLDLVHLGSLDTGIDRIPGDVEKRTPLDGKVEWTVITVNGAKVQKILRQVYGDETDGQAICICNDYADVATGGGGVVSLSKAGLTPVGHEVGHSLGALLDEYDYEPGTNPDRLSPKGRTGNVPTEAMPPNVMRGSDREDVLRKAIWRNWIDAGETRWWNRSKVGVFEGANRVPFEHWRPQMDCKMRNAGSRFCVVCMEVMVKSIYRYVRPIDDFAPKERDLELPKDRELVLKVYPMKPETHFLEAKWYIEYLGYLAPGRAASEDDDDEGGRTGVRRREEVEPADTNKKPPGDLYRRVFRQLEPPHGRIAEVCELRGKDLDPGGYRITVVVRDTTEWVLDDPEGLLEERHEWIVRVADE